MLTRVEFEIYIKYTSVYVIYSTISVCIFIIYLSTICKIGYNQLSEILNYYGDSEINQQIKYVIYQIGI